MPLRARESDRVADLLVSSLGDLVSPDDMLSWDVAYALISVACEDDEDEVHQVAALRVWMGLTGPAWPDGEVTCMMTLMLGADDEDIVEALTQAWEGMVFQHITANFEDEAEEKG